MSGFSVLKDRAGVSVCTDVSLAYTQFKSMNCWQFSCYDKKGRQIFIQYFGKVDYLHFVRISDAKVLNEEEAGLNTEVYVTGRTKKENEHIKYNPTLFFGTFE